jgi:hypothetical protein
MIEIGNGGPHPTPPPAPAKPTPPPSPGATSLWPWAVDQATAGAGWAISTEGYAQNDAASGRCLTAYGSGTMTMEACETGKAATQQFALDASSGNLALRSKIASCVALKGGQGPALTMASCKQGPAGANEEFTLLDGQLCSTTLHGGKAVCLRVEDKTPMPPPPAPGNGGFNCIADQAALDRCQVHMTMWTIMKVTNADDVHLMILS